VGASELSPEGFIGLEETLAAGTSTPGEQASTPKVESGSSGTSAAASAPEQDDARGRAQNPLA